MKHLFELENTSMVFQNRDGLFAPERKVGAVVDVDLQLNPGEVLAVVGESGCGKTTMGKVVTGLLKPTSGNVKFLGENIWDMNKNNFSEYRKAVQMVHQDSYAALNPALTIYKLLSAPLFRHKLVKGHEEARKRLHELFTLVGLIPPDQFLDKYPHQLSGGQRQRILLARALSIQPKLIVADEPVSMVDVSLRISLLDLMIDMNSKFDIAFIYITHDLATARYIASHGRIAVMYLGKIIEMGDLNKILEEPKHPYLRALLMAVPIPDPVIARQSRPLPLKSLDMPDPADPPQGCRFHPRCPYAEDICKKEDPELVPYEGEMVACHLKERMPKWEMGQ